MYQIIIQWIGVVLFLASTGVLANDKDSDGVVDTEDNCVSVANPNQLDTDHDGIGNDCDADDDGDGVVDINDPWPLAWQYNLDENNNHLPDSWEVKYQILSAEDASEDYDNDGLNNLD